MRPFGSVLALLLVLSCGNSGTGPPPEALVVRVVDGDTIVVRSERGEERIRLLGIDAPEMNYGRGRPECGAREATAALRAKLDRGMVRLERHGVDDYRRTLAIVLDEEDGITVNEWLLREGHAEVFWKARHSRRSRFIRAAKEAERAKRGLWGEC